MLVRKIEVIEFRRVPDPGGYAVTVCLLGRTRRVYTHCYICDTDVQQRSDIEDLVAQKVVHQLRRMPEFRARFEALQLDPSVLSPAPQFVEQENINRLAAE